MNHDEFKDELAKLGLEMENNKVSVTIFIKAGGEIVGKVYKQDIGIIDTKWSSFTALPVAVKLQLLDLMVALSKTPPKDREVPQLYYLMSKSPFLPEEEKYYKIDFSRNRAYFGSRQPVGPYQTAFTEEETNKLAAGDLERVPVLKEEKNKCH